MNNTLLIDYSNNGLLTCKVNNINLHSHYDPINESLKIFQQQLTNNNDNKLYVVIGAGLGYELEALQSITTNSIIVPIFFEKKIYELSTQHYKLLFSDQIDIFNSDFLNILKSNMNILKNINDIQILFWPPSKNIWPNLMAICLKSLKTTINNYLNEKNTLQYFFPQWLRNASLHYLNINTHYIPSITNKNIILLAAGPSLNNFIKDIKKYSENYLVMAVSSSLFCLFENEIYPDIIIHQDSSYYSSTYLNYFPKNYFPYIAHPLNTSRSLLLNKHKNIIIDTQQDIEKLFLIKNEFIKINPHASVIGSALELAWKITNKAVYIAGFDLCYSNHGSHCFPHISKNMYHHGDYLLSFENYITHEFYKTPITLENSNNNIYRQTYPLKSYSSWYSNWKNYNYLNRTYFLSLENFTHLHAKNIIKKLPSQPSQSQPSIKYNDIDYKKIDRPNILERKLKLQQLINDWNFTCEKIYNDKDKDNLNNDIYSVFKYLHSFFNYNTLKKIINNIEKYL